MLTVDILKIANLEGMDNLEKLQLDNNTIEKIENLGHLTKLKWLDLSFNCITHIDGLANLVNLTDLTLSNNRLKSLSNLVPLQKLVFLSLNNNKLESMGQMLSSIKDLKCLQVLNCSGNPFARAHPNYANFCVYHLKATLRYIDSKYIDQEMLKASSQDDKYSLEEMVKEEEGGKKADSLNVQEYEELKLMIIYKYDENILKDSKDFMVLLSNEKLFESSKNMLKDTIRQYCAALLMEVKILINDRKSDIEDFNQTMKILEGKSEEQTLALIAEYMKKKKKAKLAWEDKKPDWRKQVTELVDFINQQLDRKMMIVENDLSEAEKVEACHFRVSSISIRSKSRRATQKFQNPPQTT